MAHTRKVLAKRSRSLQTQAAVEWGAGTQLERLARDLQQLRGLVRALPDDVLAQLWVTYQRYLSAAPPRAG